MDDIEILSKRPGSLQITNETSDKTTERLVKAMSVVPVSVTTNTNKQAVIPKNIVSDPGWFNGNRTKFEDWWRGMQLFLKSNRVIETNNRITAISAHLRGGVAGIYAQKKLDKLNEELET